jgi:hypothetical protein
VKPNQNFGNERNQRENILELECPFGGLVPEHNHAEQSTGQPPSAPNITRMDSDTRQPERCALHLSNPNTRNVAALNAANQMAANESGIFNCGLVLAFYLQIGV